MMSPQMTKLSFGQLQGKGWRRIFELQRLVNNELAHVPMRGENPSSVDHRELLEIVRSLPREFDSYVLLLPDRGSNVEIYNQGLVAVLTDIVIARRRATPLTDNEIKGLLPFIS